MNPDSPVSVFARKLWDAARSGAKLPVLQVPGWRREMWSAVAAELDPGIQSGSGIYDPDLDWRIIWARQYLSWSAGTLPKVDASARFIAESLIDPSPRVISGKELAAGAAA